MVISIVLYTINNIVTHITNNNTFDDITRKIFTQKQRKLIKNIENQKKNGDKYNLISI